MDNFELYLNDDFVVFSTKMNEIHTKIKEKNDQIKVLLEQYKVEKAELEKSAKILHSEWQSKMTTKGSTTPTKK